MAERRFSDEQVAAILGRAAELSAKQQEQQQSGAAAQKAGLSVAEIEEIARQAGIDPALVARAAADVDAGAPRPSDARLEAEIDGELDDAGREALFNAVMKNGSVGMHASNPSPRTMRFVGGGGWGRDVAVTVGGGKTRLVVESLAKNQRFLGWALGGLVGGTAILLSLAAPDAGATAILASGGVGALLASGLGLGRLFEGSRRKNVARTFDELRGVIEQHVKPASTESALDDARARQGLAAAVRGADDAVAIAVAETVDAVPGRQR